MNELLIIKDRPQHLLLGLMMAAVAALLGPSVATATTTTFASSSVEQSYTVPPGVTSVHVLANGSPGANDDVSSAAIGGLGASVEADFSVTPGEILFVEVPGLADGFDGSGGMQARAPSGSSSYHGGGASDVRTVCQQDRDMGCIASPSASLASRLIVAGGGGGASNGTNGTGGSGAGGAAFSTMSGSGQAGTNGASLQDGTAGFAGTGTAGGVGGASDAIGNPGGSGSLGGGGAGGGDPSGRGGGGGGGYYGGGGGGAFSGRGGGGGGSSFANSPGLKTFRLDTTRAPQVVITPGVADITAPTITITSPADGASYPKGQVVNASYSCADPDDAVTECSGPVASGSPIDTNTVGPHAFTVNASDHADNTATKTVHYTVTSVSGGGGGPAPAIGSLGGISVSASGVTATLTCRGVAGQTCVGAATLTSLERLRGSKLVSVAARSNRAKSKHVRVTSKHVTDARASYHTPAGHRTKITLTLNRSARALLAHFKRLPATVALNGNRVRTVTFKAVKHKKKAKHRKR